MASIDATATPGSIASARAHGVAGATEAGSHGVLAIAGLAGAIHPLHAIPAAGYGLGFLGAKQAGHAHPTAVAAHVGGIVEGVSGAAFTLLRHGAHGVHQAGLRGALQTAAHTAGKLLPAALIGVGFVDAAVTLDEFGVRGLATTSRGRAGVINSIGGALLLAPHAAAKLAGAGVMALGLANDLRH